MDMIDLFDVGRVRKLWYDHQGLFKSVQRIERPPRPVRRAAFVARVASATLALNAAALAFAAEEPGQVSVAWPASEARAIAVVDVLNESLQKMRDLKSNWNGQGAPAPVQQSIAAAQYVLNQLPNVHMNASAGVDPEGHVFLRLNRGSRLAYLTVEPRSMHLLYIEPGQPNLYIDDEPFKGKIIPANILAVLNARLKA